MCYAFRWIHAYISYFYIWNNKIGYHICSDSGEFHMCDNTSVAKIQRRPTVATRNFFVAIFLENTMARIASRLQEILIGESCCPANPNCSKYSEMVFCRQKVTTQSEGFCCGVVLDIFFLSNIDILEITPFACVCVCDFQIPDYMHNTNNRLAIQLRLCYLILLTNRVIVFTCLRINIF